MALADATDGRVTGHLADVVEVQGQHQGLTAHPGCGQRRFDTGMAGSDNDHVVYHNLLPPVRLLSCPCSCFGGLSTNRTAFYGLGTLSSSTSLRTGLSKGDLLTDAELAKHPV